MKKALLQLWNYDDVPSGASINFDQNAYKGYLKTQNKNDLNGQPVEVDISNSIYIEMLNNNGTLEVMQNSYNNLTNLGQIKI